MRMVFGLVLVVGLALAGAAVWMVQGYVSNAQYQVARERAVRLQLGDLVEVYVVNKPMTYGTPITKDDVEKVLFPKKALPEGSFSDEAVLFPANSAQPRYITRTMEKTEPLLEAKVSAPGADIGLTSRLSKGKRAFAIKVDVASGVSGFVQPGDNVDIYWTGSTQNNGGEFTQLIESTVKVVAVDQASNSDRGVAATVARTVTVEATPEQVARLAQAQATGGLALSLVGAGDDTIVQNVEVDSAALLGIQSAAPEVAAEPARQCSVKTRRGAEVVEIPIPCTN
jgi:pilus assembly protein CpaB